MTELSGRRLRAADLVTGLVLAAIGGGMLVASLAMPTYAERGSALTAPGIFPGFIAGIMLVLGIMLATRTIRRASWPETGDALNWRPVLTGLGLMVAAIALLGQLDFRLVTGGFSVAFAAYFVEWRGTRSEIGRRAFATAILLVIVTVLLPGAFEHIFLVRLP